jgi:hypothetical protein
VYTFDIAFRKWKPSIVRIYLRKGKPLGQLLQRNFSFRFVLFSSLSSSPSTTVFTARKQTNLVQKTEHSKFLRFPSNMTNGIVNVNGSLETQFGESFLSFFPPHTVLISSPYSFSRHQRNKLCICSSSFEKCAAGCFFTNTHQRACFILSCYCVSAANLAPHPRTGWNDPRASPRGGFEPLRGGHTDRSSGGAFGHTAFSSPREPVSGGDWAGRPSTNGWTPREHRADGPRESPGLGAWRNGAHVVGARNPRLEKELFGDITDTSKQHTGINFEKYDDIPVEATGAGVPEPVNAFTNSPLDPVLLENIAFAHYTTPTPVQKYSIPIVAANRDLMACAQVSPMMLSSCRVCIY